MNAGFLPGMNASRAMHEDVVAHANEGLLGRDKALLKVPQINRPTGQYLNPRAQHGLARA